MVAVERGDSFVTGPERLVAVDSRSLQYIVAFVRPRLLAAIRQAFSQHIIIIKNFPLICKSKIGVHEV